MCTLTRRDRGGGEHLRGGAPRLGPPPAPGAPWSPWGGGALLLPQVEGTDGMALFAWRRPSGATPASEEEPHG
ncbi:MAG: hypothetical protein R2711_04300 [Acidimicrobiales bacterium]